MVFHWSLRDRKSPKASKTLFSLLPNFNNAIVWMVLICPPIFKPLGIVPNAPIIIAITETLLYHSFLHFPANSMYLSVFSLSLIFSLYSGFLSVTLFKLLEWQKSTWWHVIFCLLINTKSGFRTRIEWFVFSSKLLLLLLFEIQSPRGQANSYLMLMLLNTDFVVSYYL